VNANPAEGRHYQCPVCGEGFLSQLELGAHRQKYPGPHDKPRPTAHKSGRPAQVTGFHDHATHGYRESGRT
jgi:hypothetical protein